MKVIIYSPYRVEAPEGLPMELPSNVLLSQLLPDLALQMNLPHIEPRLWSEFAGNRFRRPAYILQDRYTHRPLREDQTFSDAGIAEGATLALLPYVVAGQPPFEEIMTFVSGRTFRDLALVAALRIGAIVTAIALPKHEPVRALYSWVFYELYGNKNRRCLPAVWDELENLQGDYLWRNETTGQMIQTDSNAEIGDVISTGDCIRLSGARSNATVYSLSQSENNLADSIKIYPTIVEGED